MALIRIYLDFDGTVTPVPGQIVFSTGIPDEFSKHSQNPLASPTDRKKILDKFTLEEQFKITEHAANFLRKMAKSDEVEIVFISKNYKHYIEALLEDKGVDSTKFAIYDREKIHTATTKDGKKIDISLGQHKDFAVKLHELKTQRAGNTADVFVVCDDNEKDLAKMVSPLKSTSKPIFDYHAAPGKFPWEKIEADIQSLYAKKEKYSEQPSTLFNKADEPESSKASAPTTDTKPHN